MKQVFTIPVEHFRSEAIAEQLPDGVTVRGHRSVSLGVREETIEVEVDVAALARTLGPRAVHSKGGRAVEVKGLVVVRHIRERR